MSAFHCLHCESVLGLTDGLKLVIAGIIILERSTKMRCAKCGFVRRWKPIEAAVPLCPVQGVAISVTM